MTTDTTPTPLTKEQLSEIKCGEVWRGYFGRVAMAYLPSHQDGGDHG